MCTGLHLGFVSRGLGVANGFSSIPGGGWGANLHVKATCVYVHFYLKDFYLPSPSDIINSPILILIVHDLIITGVFQNLLPGLPSSVQSQTFRGVISFLSHVLDIDVPLLVSSTTKPAQGPLDTTASSTDIATPVDTVTTIDAATCTDPSPDVATVSMCTFQDQ